MAEHQICVSQVLEGAFVGLHEVGVPLPVCMHLQDNGTRFESAQWTAKEMKSGFFGQFTPPWPKPRKPRRRRRPTKVNRITKSPAFCDFELMNYSQRKLMGQPTRTSAPTLMRTIWRIL